MYGGSGRGNNELQTDTGRPANVRIDGQGHLEITARKETYRGPHGITRGYSGVPWPQIGEIDIMESVNSMSATTGTIHGPTRRGPTSITWFLDGAAFHEITAASLPADDVWEFSKTHTVQFDLAVGGDSPGSPTSGTVLPATLLVDYIRYYSN